MVFLDYTKTENILQGDEQLEYCYGNSFGDRKKRTNEKKKQRIIWRTKENRSFIIFEIRILCS